MAYKQNKNPLRRDGASIEPISMTLAAIKVGKLIGGLIKGAKVAKGAATAAKAAKAAKATSTLAKATPKAAKLVKTTSSMPTLQTLTKATLKPIGGKPNVPPKLVTSSTPIGQTGGKVGEIKNIVSNVNTRVDDLATKASDFSKEIGLDRSPEEIKNIAKEKLMDTSSQLASSVEKTTPASIKQEEEERQFDISKSSYSNPATISMGPSKSLKTINTTQDVGKKSAQQFGAEMRFNSLAQYGTSQEDASDGFYPEQDKKQKEEESRPAGENEPSLEQSNLRPENFLKDFDAYASVGGVVFNVGDVARLGYAGVQKFIENKPKREKRRLDRKLKKGDKVENATFDFTKDKLKTKLSKGAPTGEDIVSKVAKMDKKDYLTIGIKPSYKK